MDADLPTSLYVEHLLSLEKNMKSVNYYWMYTDILNHDSSKIALEYIRVFLLYEGSQWYR